LACTARPYVSDLHNSERQERLVGGATSEGGSEKKHSEQ